MITLTPDAPNWATAGGRGGNYKVDSQDFADFARAVGRRYSGVFGGLSAVKYFSIWNEPNHIFFLKPRSQAPRVYRRLVERGVPALRAAAAPGTQIFVGELAPSAPPRKVLGPQALPPGLAVPRQAFQAPARRRGAQGRLHELQEGEGERLRPPPLRPDGHRSGEPRHHQHLGDQAPCARCSTRRPAPGGSPVASAIYNTEFGFQTNPPDPFVSTSPGRQAELLNEKEEFSYRYSRAEELLAVPAPRRSAPPRARRR